MVFSAFGIPTGFGDEAASPGNPRHELLPDAFRQEVVGAPVTAWMTQQPENLAPDSGEVPHEIALGSTALHKSARKELHVCTGQDNVRDQVTTPENMTRRALVVDDEPIVCDSIKRFLVTDHYEVETVTSGQEALDAFQRGKFDLVVIDYEMPVMKGDKLAAAIKALAPQQAIIMITGYGEALRFGGSFPLAVDMVIGKPFSLEEFREAVCRLTSKT